jgi:citrate lyase beta subunit
VKAAPQRRATLFIGALALDALEATLASGADLICIDLEDAVPPSRKSEGSTAALKAAALCERPPGVQLVVRINALSEKEGPKDLRAVVGDSRAFGGVMLPKVNGADEVRRAGEFMDVSASEADLYAIIETAAGLARCEEIAQAHPRLKALFFGGFDLSTALGCEMAWEPLLYARSRVLHAGALAGIEVIDSPHPEIADLDGLRESCLRVRALGMAGKAAKHASQVHMILECFTPTAAEIARAKAIVKLYEGDPTRPLVYEGKLVELPTVRRMQRIAGLGPIQIPS